MKEREEPRPGGAIKRREKALHDTSWGKFVEREHDVKRKSFRFTDQKSNVVTDEYREGWSRIFGAKKEPGDFDNGQ